MNGTETLDLNTLNEAYTNRLTMLHRYISLPSKPIPKKKKSESPVSAVEAEAETALNEKMFDLVCTAKEQNSDIVSLLQKKFIVEVITI